MSNNKYKVLLIEDESNIRSFVETILEANDYQVITTATCEQGIMLFSSHTPDFVILDLGLPDKDGLEFVKKVREGSNTPILVLSARTNEADKVEALDCGANDYVTKPFGTAELMARVRVALRNRHQNTDNGRVSGEKFTLYDLVIDYNRRLVFMGENEVKLTQTEYNILALLSKHTGKVLTYSAIIKEIWGALDVGGIKKLQVNMANIRKKLGSKPGDNRYVINELGVGYRIGEENM
ncbi:MAG: response regulator transcription factor [Lachnospiraceae bacterium]|nr:response regulator transcription factor [Lachnospiraceae bacterium]